ncbi:MAG: gliding motility protein GldM, partial [Ferruginibacter sp.]|nr:gliding motility protein GldM [Ferruginibacter sp.]
MALPKEPRQKMINLMYLVLTALLALNVSSEILHAFTVVNQSLVTSNNNISTANGTLYKSLEAKLKDPASAEKAQIWAPRATTAKKLSDDLNKYIEELKVSLKKEAGSKMVKGEDGVEREEYKIDDLEAATRLFGDGEGGQKKGPELEARLIKYKADMLGISPEIKAEFEKTFPVDMSPQKGQDGKEKSFTESFFHMTPTEAGLTLLSKFQNNVKNGENLVTTYCHNKIGQVELRMDKAAVLVGQTSNYVMPGEEITITAGVGSYSSQGGTSISIGGASVPVVEGQGSTSFKAGGSGKQSKSVTVNYLDQDKKQQTKTIQVEYTVGTPGGAAVMLDKMNVFYIGVENPVTIGSPTGWDKTNVSMSGGTISGSGSARVVKVSAVGKASISVVADGKPSTFEFRIKRIPDPIFKIGSGKARVPAVEFKNQKFCRAELENFDFALTFNVVGATVYFSGANFPNV